MIKSWRYWGWLGLKIAGATGVSACLYVLFDSKPGIQPTFDGVLFGFWMLPMVWVGLVWLCIRDQRFRCPVCAHRLRMPVRQGSYAAMLLNHPGTEYVCPYGHGKLLVQVWVSAESTPVWTKYGGIWEELFRSK